MKDIPTLDSSINCCLAGNAPRPMPSPLGKVPPKGAEEVRDFVKQNHIAKGNKRSVHYENANDFATLIRTSPDLASLGNPPQRGGLWRFNFQFMELCAENMVSIRKIRLCVSSGIPGPLPAAVVFRWEAVHLRPLPEAHSGTVPAAFPPGNPVPSDPCR